MPYRLASGPPLPATAGKGVRGTEGGPPKATAFLLLPPPCKRSLHGLLLVAYPLPAIAGYPPHRPLKGAPGKG